VLIVRATKKLRQRLGSATAHDAEPSTTMLGEWYATLLPWRPQQLILLVNEHTLLPVLMPLAPSASAPARLGSAIAAALATHEAPAAVVERELSEMRDCRFGPTANRSVLGIMNEFSFLADVYRRNDPGIDLLALAKELAATPCSPLYRRHTSPDRELQAFLISAAKPPHLPAAIGGAQPGGPEAERPQRPNTGPQPWPQPHHPGGRQGHHLDR
jgi:hypothetical protein